MSGTQKSGSSSHARMERVDLSSDNLSDAQRKLINEHNKTQYTKFQRQVGSKRARVLGLAITSVVASIYGFTFYQMSKDKDLIQEMEKEVMEFDEKKL